MGRHLVRRLLAEGRRVTVLDVAPLPPDLADAGASLVQGSITSRADATEAVRGATAVVHLAAKVSDYGPRASFEALNVEGTRTVLAAAVEAGVRRFVHMSSLAVFDYRRGLVDASEETPPGGHEFAYGQTKLQAEELVRSAPETLEPVIVRPGLIPYGPEDRMTVLSLFAAVERRLPILVGGGAALVSTSFIENLVDGLMLCLDHPAAAGQTVHLADDVKLSWRELVEAIGRALDVRPNLRSTPGWLARLAAWLLEGTWRLLRVRSAPPLTRYRARTATSDLHLSNALAKDLLGYRPRVTLEEGPARRGTLDTERARRERSGSRDRCQRLARRQPRPELVVRGPARARVAARQLAHVAPRGPGAGAGPGRRHRPREPARRLPGGRARLPLRGGRLDERAPRSGDVGRERERHRARHRGGP
jgi:nucleoside-diphosphate-sugar epimerase